MNQDRWKAAAKTLALAAFVFLGLGAKEARANIYTEVDYFNNTGATLTLAGVSNWNSQRWITTNPSGAPNTPVCATAGPPQTIAPGQSGCFYSDATNLTTGTGATITYAVTPAPEYDGNGNPITIPPISVAWTWNTPFFSEGPVNDGDWSASAEITAAGQPPFTSNQTGTTEQGFSTGYDQPNGNYVQFGLVSAPPTGSITAGLSGGVNTPVTITGSGFVPGNEMQVLFGGHAGIVTCASSVTCTAYPQLMGSLTQGAVAVQLGIAGNLASVGEFIWNPTGPGCSYSWTVTGNPYEAGQPVTINIQCAPLASDNTILVYEQADVSGGWEIVYNGYPRNAGSPTVGFFNATTSSSHTFVACLETGEIPFPGQNGCDEPDDVMIGILHHKL